MVLKASGRSLSTTRSDCIIRRLKFTYGVYEYGYREILFIHTYIYGTYIYGVYILIRFGPTLLINTVVL